MIAPLDFSSMSETLKALTADLPVWLSQIITISVVAIAALTVSYLLHRIFFRILRRLAKGSESAADDILVRNLARPTRYAFMALGLALAAREVPALASVWDKVSGFLMPALLGWVSLAVMRTLVRAMELKTDISQPNNRAARRRRTRMAIFSRIATFIIIFVTIALMLLSIPGVRDIGVTLMASAGLAGLAVGAAAQPALKSLIGGLQMALTEPISIDDVVIIAGEWGKIEDIRTTYVVVRIWDDRRLIVPMSKFLDDTFENWTRTGSELLCYTYLYLDPLTEIQPIREEFERQLAASKYWDGRLCVLHVSDSTPQSIQVRLLMSAHDAAIAWELRCEIRESMLDWIRTTRPEAIARHRLDTNPPGARKSDGILPS